MPGNYNTGLYCKVFPHGSGVSLCICRNIVDRPLPYPLCDAPRMSSHVEAISPVGPPGTSTPTLIYNSELQ